MKPRKLTLAGFGSFAQEQSLDFESLEGFFLIRGETGAGKTTLFDALVWCLYGDLPGGRGGISPRSHLVGEDYLAFVDFSFAMGKREVRVRREMEYLRPKKSGQGKTKEAPSLSLWIDGQVQVGHANEREDQIQTLIGLKKEEFAKVILLPQGEFEAFLMANSIERQELLSRIFPLDDYEAVTQRANERYGEIKNNWSFLTGSSSRSKRRIRVWLRKTSRLGARR
jgi:exonuclease SbcC